MTLSRPPAMPSLPSDMRDDEEQQRIAQQKVAYKAELERQIMAKQQQQQQGLRPSTTEVAPDDEFAIHAPSPEDLFGLLKLCGSEDGVIAYLARLWSMSTTAIGPTVRGWIKALPDVPPPSRQRSAPPVISPAVSAFALANATAGQHAKRPPQVMQIREPPPSAPVPTSAPNLVAAMRALDARLSA